MDLRLTFNEDAINYDRFRPTYPEELFRDIINYSSIDEGSNSLEIGIGTGQATESILQTSCFVNAVELGDKLSNFVKNKFRKYSNINVTNADFITLPLTANSYNLVYCATAFHWLPLEGGYRKVNDILKYGGTIALFWNHPFPNRKDDISNIVNRHVYDKYCPTDKKILNSRKRTVNGARVNWYSLDLKILKQNCIIASVLLLLILILLYLIHI